mgnify:CR=1 FL=1
MQPDSTFTEEAGEEQDKKYSSDDYRHKDTYHQSQKKAVRSGYDMDILPTDIITYEKDTLDLLDDLNSSNQKMVKMTFPQFHICTAS